MVYRNFSLLTTLPPPPVMILDGKLKVSQGNSNESRDDNENDEDNEQNTINSVNPMAPDTGKNVVEFNINCTERKKPSHGHLWNSSSVPNRGWNFPRVFCSSTWSLKICVTVLTSNTT